MTLQLRHHHEIAIDNARTATPQAHIARWTTPPCQKAYAKKMQASVVPKIVTDHENLLANEILELLADGRERTVGDVCSARGIYQDYTKYVDEDYRSKYNVIAYCLRTLSRRGIIKSAKLPYTQTGYRLK